MRPKDGSLLHMGGQLRRSSQLQGEPNFPYADGDLSPQFLLLRLLTQLLRNFAPCVDAVRTVFPALPFLYANSIFHGCSTAGGRVCEIL